MNHILRGLFLGFFALSGLAHSQVIYPVSGPDIRIRQNGNPGFAGAQCLMDVSVNGQFVAQVHAGEPLSIDVTAGQFIVEIESSRDKHYVRFPPSVPGGAEEYWPAGCSRWKTGRMVSSYQPTRLNLYIEPF